jgi:hypothetical protein
MWPLSLPSFKLIETDSGVDTPGLTPLLSSQANPNKFIQEVQP